MTFRILPYRDFGKRRELTLEGWTDALDSQTKRIAISSGIQIELNILVLCFDDRTAGS
jgi:hypothetical protein